MGACGAWGHAGGSAISRVYGFTGTGEEHSKPAGSDPGPLQIFLLLVPLSWWQFTVKQTNLYAERSREEQGLPHGRGRSWTPVSLQELLRWFGLVLAMALHPLPSLNRYWQTEVRGAIRFPGFGSFMF